MPRRPVGRAFRALGAGRVALARCCSRDAATHARGSGASRDAVWCGPGPPHRAPGQFRFPSLHAELDSIPPLPHHLPIMPFQAGSRQAVFGPALLPFGSHCKARGTPCRGSPHLLGPPEQAVIPVITHWSSIHSTTAQHSSHRTPNREPPKLRGRYLTGCPTLHGGSLPDAAAPRQLVS